MAAPRSEFFSLAGADRTRRASGICALALAVCWVLAAMLEGFVVDYHVVSDHDLVKDIAKWQLIWVLAQVLLILVVPLLLPVCVGVISVTGPGSLAVWSGLAMMALSGGTTAMSGVFHGVLGVHLRYFDHLDEPKRTTAVIVGDVLHALGDTCYDIAIVATSLALLAFVPALRRTRVVPRGLIVLAVAAAAFEIVEFGYFIKPLPLFTFVAPAGVLLQGAWYCWLGLLLLRLSQSASPHPTGIK